MFKEDNITQLENKNKEKLEKYIYLRQKIFQEKKTNKYKYEEE